MDWQTAAITLGIICIAALALILYLCRRFAAEGARAVEGEALVQDAPLGILWVGPDGWHGNIEARRILGLDTGAPVPTETLVQALTPDHRRRLLAELSFLIVDQQEFEASADAMQDRRALSFSGRMLNGRAVVWLRDDSASVWLAEKVAEQEREVARLQGVLNTLPMPIWWRHPETLEIAGSNTAYDELLGIGDDPSRARTLARLALRTAMPQTESRHLVREGSRYAIDVTEAPVEGFPGTVAGIGRDMTALENLQMSLAEHISVQDQVLERLTSAIAIFGPDRRLKFFNRAFSEMWRVPGTVLDEQPTIATLMGILREKRLLQETSDFPAYRRSREALFTKLIEPIEDLIHVPDGRAIRAVISPHPLGGLIFQYEDVTDRLALESSHNTLSAVQRSTLNSLFEGVCVFGRDGRLKLFNSVYAEMFDLDPAWLSQGPHVAEVAEMGRGKLAVEGDWPTLKRRLVNYIAEPRSRHGRMVMSNDKVYDYAYVPLPDGQCLVLYLDVTDSTQVEEALRERNRALENADLLKSRFISNVSYELRTPLNAIMGFAELLKMGNFGSLTERQETYVGDIFSAAVDLSDLIADILDLAAVQAGFMQFDNRTFDLGDVAEDVVAALRGRLPTGARIETGGFAKGAALRGDPRRIKQALTCLLEDAVRHLPEEGCLSVSLMMDTDGAPNLEIHVPLRGIQEISWARLVTEDITSEQPDQVLATGADIGISLGRSLIFAQGGGFRPAEDRETLLCRFPGIRMEKS